MFRGDSNFFFFFGYVYLFVCVGGVVCMPRHTCGGQKITSGVGSLLVSCGSWGSNLERQAWQQAPLLMSHLVIPPSIILKIIRL